jgi:ribosomal protein S18 acetylase RimI-like enzyme
VPDDVGALVEIQHRAGRSAHPESYRRAIGDPGRCVLVAVPTRVGDGPGTVVGWAQTYHQDEATDPAPVGHYLGGVTVDPRWRRRGVAAALTGARMAWIGERAAAAHYVVNARNRASIALHEPWGFAEVARGPRLSGITFDGGVGVLLRAATRPPADRPESPQRSRTTCDPSPP